MPAKKIVKLIKEKFEITFFFGWLDIMKFKEIYSLIIINIYIILNLMCMKYNIKNHLSVVI